jgi:protein-S-isoprenylcysteine O-methyltransferase Ste14
MFMLYWPGLAAGFIVGFYWGRVLRMAVKARRQAGHSANLIPPEPLGKALRLIWFPVIFLWIAVPFSVFRGVRGPGLRLLYNNPAAWLGIVVSAAALGGTLVCWKRMGRDWRMGIDPAEKNHLIVSGPFGYVRHPIYALSQVMMLGTVVAVPTVAMIVVAVAHVLLLQWEARREEAHLLSVHGTEYARYLQEVGRFLPRSLTAYSPPPSHPTEA